jgi:hypothetical protein
MDNEKINLLKEFTQTMLSHCEPTEENAAYISSYQNILNEIYNIEKEQPQTNFDKIKAMTVEEMAEFLIKIEEDTLSGETWGYAENVQQYLESEGTK